MESLLQTLLVEITENPSVQTIVRYVPRFVAYANTLTIPGAEKHATVLRGLHELTLALQQADKISIDLQTELDQFVDLTVPSMIEAILDVAAGRVELKMPTSVPEVVPKVNCLLGLVHVILRMAGKSKEAKAVAEVAALVKTVSPPEIVVDAGVVIPPQEAASATPEAAETETTPEAV